ncbi:MAG TPA: LysR family transcriptional regulator [Burkholderiales bacterium]
MQQIDRLHGILVYLRVVELGSMSRGARALGVSAAAVSAALGRLERKLGVRLLNRTTRRLSVTAEGADFYARCKRIAADLDEATQVVGQAGRIPSGKLRVGMPAAVGRLCIVPHLPQFMAKYPAISLEIVFSNFVPYAMDANLDISVEIGELPASRLSARRLASTHYVLCAARSYLDKHGTPATPGELLAHQCLTYRRPRDGRVRDWSFCDGGSVRHLPVEGCMTFNNGEALVAAARAGLGIIQVADYYARADIENAQLIELMPELKTGGHDISVVYYQPRVVPKVRAFVDFLVNVFDRPQWSTTAAARKPQSRGIRGARTNSSSRR